jgi:hypothetical protein
MRYEVEDRNQAASCETERQKIRKAVFYHQATKAPRKAKDFKQERRERRQEFSLLTLFPPVQSHFSCFGFPCDDLVVKSFFWF